VPASSHRPTHSGTRDVRWIPALAGTGFGARKPAVYTCGVVNNGVVQLRIDRRLFDNHLVRVWIADHRAVSTRKGNHDSFDLAEVALIDVDVVHLAVHPAGNTVELYVEKGLGVDPHVPDPSALQRQLQLIALLPSTASTFSSSTFVPLAA